MSQNRLQRALSSTLSEEEPAFGTGITQTATDTAEGNGSPAEAGTRVSTVSRWQRFDAVATLLIAVLAFILSYSKLTDLAARAGYTERMAYLWPLIVDGLAVVAALGVLRLQSQRWYAWTLLVASTSVSVIAAVASAMFRNGPLPPVAAALVSVVPPLCLLVAPHLAVLLVREQGNVAPVSVAAATVSPVAPHDVAQVAVEEAKSSDVARSKVATDPVPQLVAVPDRRAQALHLLAEGVSQREVARRFGVSDTTVRRWRRAA